MPLDVRAKLPMLLRGNMDAWHCSLFTYEFHLLHKIHAQTTFSDLYIPCRHYPGDEYKATTAGHDESCCMARHGESVSLLGSFDSFAETASQQIFDLFGRL